MGAPTIAVFRLDEVGSLVVVRRVVPVVTRSTGVCTVLARGVPEFPELLT